jgi:hypothetical protein
MARHHAIPARARVGFATYFVAGLHLDHEVAEVWDAREDRWRLIDAELGDDHVDQSDGVRIPGGGAARRRDARPLIGSADRVREPLRG